MNALLCITNAKNFLSAASLCVTQVRGFCKDKSNEEVFENVNVYGNIYDSDIHNNHFGVYTYGESGDSRFAL